MKKNCNKCVIYARVSTIDKQSYDRQINDLKDFAKIKKLKVDKIFSEKISGTIDAKERPAFKEMLNYIEKYDIHHVLVTELSRLGRKMRDTINIIHDFNEKKICVHILQDSLTTLDENLNENKITSLIINILTSFSDIERSFSIERSKSGIRHNVKNQGSGTGIIKPYGYKKEGKKLIVDEEEAKIVEFIFDKYVNGYGSQQIANLLNENKIKTKYNKLFVLNKTIRTRSGEIKKSQSYVWRDATIISILKNTIYIGDRRHKGEIFFITPIIDEKTFNQAQVIRKEKYNKKHVNTKYQNIFQGKIKCPICKSGYFLHKRKDNRDNAYKCLSKRLKEINCNNNSVNIDKLNNAIYQILKEAFKLQSLLDQKLKSKAIKISDTITLLEAEKSQYNKEVNKLNARQKKLLKSYLDEAIDSRLYTEMNDEIINDLNSYENKLIQKEKDINEHKKILEVLSASTHNKLYNIDIFKKYIQNYISSIKIFDVTDLINMGDLGGLFKVKNDVISLIEVKTDLIEDYNTFLISRYSQNLVKIDLYNTEDLDKIIPYMTDYHLLKIGNEIII